MQPFSYHRAASSADAVQAGGKFIAGGTNLIDLMKQGVERPTRLTDVSRLPLTDISEREGGLRIGALARNSHTADHPLVRLGYPLLTQALLAGASGQIRNKATAGGNLLQRTRCFYFYDTATPCNKRAPGSGCAALEGFNRIHAILGASPQCIAVHPSDMAVALAALDATVQVEGPGGSRNVPLADLHRLPGSHPEQDHTLKPGELIVAIDLPESTRGLAAHSHYLKVRDRASYAFALVSVAAGLEVSGGVIRKARVALGGVAHKPWRVPSAEGAMEGQPARRETYAAAADALLQGAQGHGHNDFKIELARRAVVRAFEEAAG